MRALTVQQPWAWAIVHGGKDVENRTRNLAGSYRGPIAIHAGLQVSRAGVDHSLLRPEWSVASGYIRVHDGVAEISYPDRAATYARNRISAVMPVGAVVGVVDLVGVHGEWDCMGGPTESMCSVWGETACRGSHDDVCPASVRPMVHLELANPRPLATPIPATGRLGLWTPDAELLAQIREQVPA